jgi:hypothetical protein
LRASVEINLFFVSRRLKLEEGGSALSLCIKKREDRGHSSQWEGTETTEEEEEREAEGARERDSEGVS